MLVVDLHALQTVDVLHFVNDVARQGLDPQQAKDVLRLGGAVDDQFALVHHLAFVHQHVLFLRDQELVGVTVQVGDDQADLAFGFLAEGDGAGGFGQHAGVLGRAGLEQLGHARQTAGDVAGLLAFHRDAREHFARAYVLAVAHLDQRAHGEADGHCVIGARNLDLLALLVEQLDLWTYHLGRAAAFRVDDHQGGQAGDFVHLLGHGHAFFDVLELGLSRVLGDDGAGQRIPVGHQRAGLDHHAVLDEQRGAVRHLVTLALAAVVVSDQYLARAGDDHLLALGVGDIAHGGGEAHRARTLGFHTGHDCCTRCRAADVESPHGQLGAGFADGLRGDHADRFAIGHQRAAAEVAAVALGADAVAGFAGQRGAHLDLVDTGSFDQIEHVFIEHLARRNDDLLGLGVDHVDSGHTAEHAVAQRFDDFAAFDQRAHIGAVGRAAIVLGDHQILRHVHQTAGEVAGVRSLQRGVGQTLARAVRGDEVLQHVQAFTEVRRDGGLDDGAVWLGHQAAHASELTDLRSGATGARVGHHVDGIERLLTHVLAMTILDRLVGEVIHQRLADFIARTAPDVHHLVVALALRHQTGGVLLLDFLDFLFGASDDRVLLFRNQHVVDADRDAGLGRQREARLQQLVGEDRGFAQAATAERRVDQARDFLLLQRLVHHAERQALGQNFR